MIRVCDDVKSCETSISGSAVYEVVCVGSEVERVPLHILHVSVALHSSLIVLLVRKQRALSVSSRSVCAAEARVWGDVP
jgi:hypothetical protein